MWMPRKVAVISTMERVLKLTLLMIIIYQGSCDDIEKDKCCVEGYDDGPDVCKLCSCDPGTVARCENGKFICQECGKDQYGPDYSCLFNKDYCWSMSQCNYTHMVPIFDGNRTTDRICGCDKGYKIVHHSCVEDKTPHQPTTVKPYETSTIEFNSTTLNVTEISPTEPTIGNGKLIGISIGITCGLVSVIVIVILIVIFYYKKCRNRSDPSEDYALQDQSTPMTTLDGQEAA